MWLLLAAGKQISYYFSVQLNEINSRSNRVDKPIQSEQSDVITPTERKLIIMTVSGASFQLGTLHQEAEAANV